MKFFTLLKKMRVSIGLIVLALTLSLFIDLYEKLPTSIFSKIVWLQFVPSILKFAQTTSFIAAGGFIVILLLTLLMGRIYCSTICPLGILQDLISYISKKISHKRVFYKYQKGHPIWRYIFLTIMTIAMISGTGFIVAWLDPYSLAGRFFTYLAEPAVTLINNGSATVLESANLYTLKHIALPHVSVTTLSITLLLAVIIALMAWKKGRFFCNTICPVGTGLGLISEFSLLKIRFNADNCTKCGKCAAVCKSECISIKEQKVDTSRCVTCFNCLSVCEDSAITIGIKKPVKDKPETTPQPATHHSNTSRRQMLLTGLAIVAGTKLYAAVQNHKGGKGNSHLAYNKRDHFASPPGSGSVSRFNNKCTACSLCISACPTHVLQPAVTQYGLAGFMQPFMDYNTSYCNFDCHICGDICPTGAIIPLLLEEKQHIQLGKAIFLKQNCVVNTDGTNCGACAEHCPTKAVKMIPFKGELLIPDVDQSICIGCGACEYACPVPAPYKAIYVNGNNQHQTAASPVVEEQAEVGFEEDFPF